MAGSPPCRTRRCRFSAQQLVAALSVGHEIIHLRHIAYDLGLGSKVNAALAALADGHSARAIAQLTRLDHVLATDAADGPRTAVILRARASILVLADALTRHGAYFDAGARP